MSSRQSTRGKKGGRILNFQDRRAAGDLEDTTVLPGETLPAMGTELRFARFFIHKNPEAAGSRLCISEVNRPNPQAIPVSLVHEDTRSGRALIPRSGNGAVGTADEHPGVAVALGLPAGLREEVLGFDPDINPVGSLALGASAPPVEFGAQRRPPRGVRGIARVGLIDAEIVETAFTFDEIVGQVRCDTRKPQVVVIVRNGSNVDRLDQLTLEEEADGLRCELEGENAEAFGHIKAGVVS